MQGSKAGRCELLFVFACPPRPLLVGDKPTLAPTVHWVINLRTNKRGLVATALGLNIGQRLPQAYDRPGLPEKPQG